MNANLFRVCVVRFAGFSYVYRHTASSHAFSAASKQYGVVHVSQSRTMRWRPVLLHVRVNTHDLCRQPGLEPYAYLIPRLPLPPPSSLLPDVVALSPPPSPRSSTLSGHNDHSNGIHNCGSAGFPLPGFAIFPGGAFVAGYSRLRPDLAFSACRCFPVRFHITSEHLTTGHG